MSNRVYLAVHVPEFQAQALLRLRPELLREPVAVLRGTPPLQEVCSINAAARHLGVHAGMTRAQLDSFARVKVLTASSKAEDNARQAIMEALSVFTPAIEPQPVINPAYRLLIDLTGTSLLWGEARQAVQRTAAALRSLRLTARMAASGNAQASLCLASVARGEPVIAAPGGEANALAPLPLAALALTPEQTETLALWGLRTLGEFASLPVDAVVTRMGQEGKRLHSIASGSASHLLQPQEASLRLEEAVEFDALVDDLDSLLFVLGPMLDQLIRRAMGHAYALASVTATFKLDRGGEHIRTVGPALPSSDRKALLKLMQLDLQAHPPPAGILGVQIHAEPGIRSQVQAGLFAPQLPEPMRLDITLARIAAYVGEDRVGRARLLDTYDSDRGFVMEPFAVSTNSLQPGNQRKRLKPPPVPALRRCRPPVLLRVHTLDHKGVIQPRSFYFRGTRYAVSEVYGPWRQSGDWWSADVWSREEWDINAESKLNDAPLLAVLRHDLLRSQWTLEAIYD